MADNDISVLGSTDPSAHPVATDDIGGNRYQRIKSGWGDDGVWHEPRDVDGERYPVGGGQIGATDEAAPGSDTGVAGLNGRLQRIAQRLSSILTQLTTSVVTICTEVSVTVTVAGGQATSPVIDTAGFRYFTLHVPSTFDGSQITFTASPTSGGTFQALYDMWNNQVQMTVANTRSYDLPGELSGCRYWKIVCVTTQVGNTDFILSMRS